MAFPEGQYAHFLENNKSLKPTKPLHFHLEEGDQVRNRKIHPWKLMNCRCG